MNMLVMRILLSVLYTFMGNIDYTAMAKVSNMNWTSKNVISLYVPRRQ